MIKLLTVLGASCALGSVFAQAEQASVDHQGGAMFAARGAETQRITIGGYIQAQHQWVDVNDCTSVNCDPQEYNNFLMSHIRLFVRAELGCGWSALMNVDFAGESRKEFSDEFKMGSTPTNRTNQSDKDADLEGGHELVRSCECKDQCKISVDRAYIQKVWCDSTWRFGYQKVQWGAEWNTPEPHLKTVERSVATNFFQQVGRRVNGGQHVAPVNATSYTASNWTWVGNKLGGRRVGVYLAGQVCDFHYSAALTNGYDGLCLNSTENNNSLGFYGSLAYETTVCEFDILMGVNFAFQDKGSNAVKSKNHNVYGFNPYALVNWNRLSVLGEFFWVSVEDAKVTARTGDANPWGFNLVPSYMVNDCLELVGRFSYVNTDEMGTTIHNSFGCAPDKGQTLNADKTIQTANTKISSNTLFEKVYAGYLGVNYYMLNGAVKASVGIEQAKFKNRGFGPNAYCVNFGSDDNKGAKINSVRTAVQVLF